MQFSLAGRQRHRAGFDAFFSYFYVSLSFTMRQAVPKQTCLN
jgi:hypothetical protein